MRRQVSFTGGILVGDVTVTSPTTAIVQIAVQASATIGLQNVTVSTGGEIATLNNAFTVTGATPYLISVAPSSGQQGQTLDVILTGNAYTTFPPGVYTPPFNGPIIADFTGEITVNTITVSSASSVDVNITISPERQRGRDHGDAHAESQRRSDAVPIRLLGDAFQRRHHQRDAHLRAAGRPVDAHRDRLNTLWVQGTTTAAFYPVPVPAPSFDEITITDATDAPLDCRGSHQHPAGNLWVLHGHRRPDCQRHDECVRGDADLDDEPGQRPASLRRRCQQLQRQLYRPVHQLGSRRLCRSSPAKASR